MRTTLVAALAVFAAVSSMGVSVGAAHAARFTPSLIAEPERGQGTLQMVQFGSNRGDNRGGADRGRDRGRDRDAFRDRSYWDRRQGRGYYNDNYRDYRRDNDSALAAGFLGFVLGAAIAGSDNERTYATARLNDRGWNNACSRRYRSFDPRSGTYLGFDGYRHYCR